MSAGIEISVTVATDSWRSIQMLVRSLALQDSPERIELVVASPEGDRLELGPEVEALGGVQLIEADVIGALGDSRAAMFEAATAPVVMLGETHCFPGDGWLDAVLDAHRQGAPLVGPRVEPFNPGSRASWANQIEHYGAWTDIDSTGPASQVSGHNSTFLRAGLEPLGSEVGAALRDFLGLQAVLTAERPAVLTHEATVKHMNISSLRWWLVEAWAGGRIGATARSRHWPGARRWGYACAWPLIAAVEYGRRRTHLKRVKRRRPLPWGVAPLLLMGIAVRCLGEAFGFLAGSTERSEQLLALTEIRRFDYLTAPDQDLARSRGESMARALSNTAPATAAHE